MSFMFEVYYRPPPDQHREAVLTAQVTPFGGRLTYREVPGNGGTGGVCLTYEFDERRNAEIAAEALRSAGEHVEGPVDYEPGT